MKARCYDVSRVISAVGLTTVNSNHGVTSLHDRDEFISFISIMEGTCHHHHLGT